MQGWKYLFITWKLNEKGEWKFDEASDDQVKRGYESYDIAGAARGLGLERWELISINIYPVPSAHESVQVMLTTFKQPITG